MNTACCIRCDVTFKRLREVLAQAGFHCERFLSETVLLRTLRRQHFDLILADTDAHSPGENNIYSWLNCRTGKSTPVVMLSPVCNASEVALALNSGADDFIQETCEPAELIARLQAIMRRRDRKSAARTIEVQGFSLDRGTSSVQDRGVTVELTTREFMMAWLLFSSPGTSFSRETISTAIWGLDSEIASRTIEQHIYKLRKKLNLCRERCVRIRSAYNQGYRLEVYGENTADAPVHSPESKPTPAFSYA